MLYLNDDLKAILTKGNQIKDSSDAQIHQKVDQYLRLAEKLLEVSEHKLSEPSNFAPLFKTTSGSDVNQFACFDILAKTSILRALSYDKRPSAKAKILNLSEKISNFFSTLNDTNVKVNFLTSQSALACLESLNTLKKLAPEKDLYLASQRKIFKSLLSTYWDGKGLGLCVEDGGLFAGLASSNPNPNSICRESKSIADNSWLYYLLPDDFESIAVDTLKKE